MQLHLKNLKFTTKTSVVILALCFSYFANAQEANNSSKVSSELELNTSKDTLQTAPQVITIGQNTKVYKDTVSNFKPFKVDGVSAVVGDFIVLDSDIDKVFLQLEAQGANTEDVTRCQLFGKLLEDKLYAHHAIQDSVVIDDERIRAGVNRQIEMFVQQSGKSIKELAEFYKKDNEQDLREEMFTINKNNELANEMQRKIVEKVEITPDEVREFFNKIPKEERPFFGTELKVAQIVIEPEVSEENKQNTINQLRQFKADVLDNGASFRSKVVLYSDDKASIPNGGLYTLNRNQPRMVKEFRDVAFSLQEGEISEPFETDFGYHIIQLEKVRGIEYDVRHILSIPEVSNAAIDNAKKKLETIRQRIVDGDISFSDAARESSDEIQTRSEGGQLINPNTQDYNFELTKMDPELYAQIQNLKDGEVSLILTDQDPSGKIQFKILTVTDRINEHQADFAKDYIKIKELALNEKRIKAIAKWQSEKIIDTYIKVNDEYQSCEFASNWLKR